MKSDKGKDCDLKKLESFVLKLNETKFLNSKGEVIWSRFGNEVGLNKATISKYKKYGVITKLGLQKIYSTYPGKFDVTKFGYKVEEFKSFQRQIISPHYYYYHFGEISKSDFKENIKPYFKDVVEKFSEAKKSFEIYMYLPRGKNEALIGSKIFHDEQKTYFNTLYQAFEQKRIKKYNRILVLPLEFDQQLPIDVNEVIATGKKPEQNNKEIDKFSCIKEALELVFLEEFDHLWKCLCLSEENKNYNFNLYVHKRPSRLYSFGILDKKILIKEHDRYNEHSFAQPDMLYVYEKNGDPKEEQSVTRMIHTYQDVINKAIKRGGTEQPPVWKITKSNFERVIKFHLKDINKKITQIEELVRQNTENDNFDEFFWSDLRDKLIEKREALSKKADIVSPQ